MIYLELIIKKVVLMIDIVVIKMVVKHKYLNQLASTDVDECNLETNKYKN